MTNRELAAKCKDIALNYKTVYVLGGFGAPMTAEYKIRCVEQYYYNNRSSTWYATADTFAFDCIGIIKGLCWDFSGNLNAAYGGAKYASNGVPDVGANMAISMCSDVTTDFSHIEIGEAVWLDGHIGVYIGDGLAVECTPAWENKVQITAVGNIGKQVKYNTRTWTKHGKLPWVEYVTETPAETSNETSDETSNENALPVKGIDVSRWNGVIEWDKVKAAGYKFAMLRLGYGSADGESCGIDRMFESYVDGAAKAGIDIGCYFYSYATSEKAAKKEAEFVLGVLEKYKKTFAYPVAYDLEDNSQVGLSRNTLTGMVMTFADTLKSAGWRPMLYTNLNWLRNYLNRDELDIDIWLAQWAVEPTDSVDFGMWQCSATGSVDGISGNVDLDYAYRGYPYIINDCGWNGFTENSTAQIIADKVHEAVEKIAEMAKNAGKTKPKGDVDGDGKVTSKDARTALRAAVGLETLNDEEKAAADMNADGKITAADAREILKEAVRNENEKTS